MRPDDDFNAYCAARWKPLVRSAVLLGCTGPDAEDVVQSAMEKAYRHWVRVRRAESVDGYVHRILVNTLRNSRRRRWWGETPTDELVAAGDHRDIDPVALDVRRALKAMSRRHREVLVLRFYSDLSEQATADVLDIPLGTVKSRTSRALKILSQDPLMLALENGEFG